MDCSSPDPKKRCSYRSRTDLGVFCVYTFPCASSQVLPFGWEETIPRDHQHDVNKHASAAWELANFIDGKRTMLEIAHAVIAECVGPMPEKSAEFFYGLEKNGVIELKKK